MTNRFQEHMDHELVVPFDPSCREALVSGRQTATTRRKPIGDAGTRFIAFGTTFEVVTVAKKFLADIAQDHYAQEGFETPAAFRIAWAERHPRRGWQPGQLAFHHVIKQVSC